MRAQHAKINSDSNSKNPNRFSLPRFPLSLSLSLSLSLLSYSNCCGPPCLCCVCIEVFCWLAKHVPGMCVCIAWFVPARRTRRLRRCESEGCPSSWLGVLVRVCGAKGARFSIWTADKVLLSFTSSNRDNSLITLPLTLWSNLEELLQGILGKRNIGTMLYSIYKRKISIYFI